jgi:hypothetical protein
MFFYIGDDCPIKSMKQVEPRLFVDEGWNQKNGIWYKGYSTECILEDSIYDIVNGHQPSGKYCVICNGEVYHPILRGFPLYFNGHKKTNLKLDDFEAEIYKPEPMPDIEPELSLDEASILIGDILVENTKNLYKYNEVDNMTSLCSAGLDTLTVWAVVDQVTQDYNFSLYIPTIDDMVDMRSFNGTRRNYSSDLLDKVDKDYWGYYHANFYTQPNWNITGYYAEVYTYRDGEAINAIANYHGKRIDELADESDYLYWFLKRPNIVERYKDSMMQFENEEELKKFLWSTIWFDHQMWHLDNNINFSPFADLRIPTIVNRMSVEDITHNCVSGQIQRNIINRFKPEALCLLSDYKNAQDVWGNFKENFNESMIHPDTKIIYR